MAAVIKTNTSIIPRLWLKRIVLFESRETIKTPIREIMFHRGLNIVWGVELPDDAGINDAHPVTLSGHSVGKTTFCRLIRYCLGENTFGNSGAMDRIRNSFPKGWVGLELNVDGQEWAVLKPVGRSGNSMAAKLSKIENLFDAPHENHHYRNFLNHLNSIMFSDLRASTPPNSGKPYEWKHLLAWLTRDQEARFQSLHDWRSPRSESDTPRFDRPKEHALYLIRLILDLLHEKEVNAARALADMEEKLKHVEEKIKNLQHEPQYRLKEQEEALKDMLGLPQDAVLDADEDDLTSPVYLYRTNLNNLIARLEQSIEKIERKVANKRFWLAAYDEERRQFRAVYEITEEATESSKEDDTILQLKEIWGKYCQHGNIAFRECSYVQNRLKEAEDNVISLDNKREDRRVAAETMDRLKILEQTQQKHDEIVGLINDLRRKLDQDIKEKLDKERELTHYRSDLDRLNHHLTLRQNALNLLKGQKINTSLQQETTHAAELSEHIQRQKEIVENLHADYQDKLHAITSVYDGLIKSALSNTYSGALNMTKGELKFEIEESAGLSGEAVETLALVIADVAAMMCSCEGIGYHPRFLVHDSPREADLDRHIYNRYLLAMWELTQKYGGKNTAPYQYFVTTTSRPPDEIHGAICLRLEAYPPEHMLFRRLLKNTDNPTTGSLLS